MEKTTHLIFPSKLYGYWSDGLIADKATLLKKCVAGKATARF